MSLFQDGQRSSDEVEGGNEDLEMNQVGRANEDQTSREEKSNRRMFGSSVQLSYDSEMRPLRS